MVIFHSYVSLPEGTCLHKQVLIWSHLGPMMYTRESLRYHLAGMIPARGCCRWLVNVLQLTTQIASRTISDLFSVPISSGICTAFSHHDSDNDTNNTSSDTKYHNVDFSDIYRLFLLCFSFLLLSLFQWEIFRIQLMEVRKRTIFLAIFSGDIPIFP